LLFAFLYRKTERKGATFPDSKLMNRYRQTGDPELIGLLFDRYVHLVYGVCLKYLKNEASAEDAVMEIFESLFDLLLRHRIDNFPAWLHRVSSNHCLMKLRRFGPGGKNREVTFAEIPASFMENPEDLHHHDGKEKNRIAMENALNGLKEEQQKCLRLFYFEDKSYREVANITGMSLNSIKSHIQNGKRNLKMMLQQNDEKA